MVFLMVKNVFFPFLELILRRYTSGYLEMANKENYDTSYFDDENDMGEDDEDFSDVGSD